MGVRVAEFHGLSPFALYVHPSPALKLQQLWDDGNELVRGSLVHQALFYNRITVTPVRASLFLYMHADSLMNKQHAVAVISLYASLTPGLQACLWGQR